MKTNLLLGVLMTLLAGLVQAQVRPPVFMGNVPGIAQMRAIEVQRHQARTLLYREALEELRKNPAAADVPECKGGQQPETELCLVNATAGTVKRPARHVALLVGNMAYRSPIPRLETPGTDVDSIAATLAQRYGFETVMLRNAGKAEIVAALNRIARESTPDDAVVVYYAGHGYLMDDTNMGYWIPVDASVKTAANWISNTDIGKLLKAIPARQVILVSDSCFSGSLTREQKVVPSGEVDKWLTQRSVVVLSSGGEEPVSDEGKNGHSVFAWNLVQALSSRQGAAPGTTVWQEVHRNVSKDFPQEPQYGAVVSAGHVPGGDFVFRPKP